MSTDALKEAFYKTTFTLKGRIFHPYLLNTKIKTNQKTGAEREIYDVMFVWNPHDPANAQAYAALMNFINDMSPKLFQGIDPRALVNPIKSSGLPGFQEYQRQDYKPNPEYLRGMHWVNAETGKDMPPTVVNEHRQPVLDEGEVYSGRNAVVNFQLYPMLRDPNVPQKKIGYGVNLNAVMLIQGGDREGGRSTIDVNQVFGSFAQDMGMAPAPVQAPMQQAPMQQAPMQQAPMQQDPMQGYPQQAPMQAPMPQAPMPQAPMQGYPQQAPMPQAPMQGYPQQDQQQQQAPQQNFNPNGFGQY